MKVSIIGAGNVGATLAERILESGIADVVLLDVVSGLAQGKVLDLLHAAPIIGYKKNIEGTEDYERTGDSDILVITAGFPRQPGMSRADLVARNKAIVKDVVAKAKRLSPEAILIIVTNPLDVMTFLAYKESGFSRNRVMGMAGVLDSSRFAHIVASSLGVRCEEIETVIVGQHGPAMVPLISHTKISGKPIAELVPKEKLDGLIQEVREAGAKIVKLLGKGSAYYAPSAAIFAMIEAIAGNKKGIMSVSCITDGEYGLTGVSTGLPVRLGPNGIEEILTLSMSKDEKESLKKSADLTKELLSKL